MASTKVKTTPTIEQMRLHNAESREWVINAVERAARHRADKANWPDDVCRSCGHWGCLRFEEESCNHDHCSPCNEAADASYCLKGQHEWSYRSPYDERPTWCICCGAWDIPDEDEDW